MAKLIVNPTSSSRREVPLPRSMLSIGRDPSNDVVLPDAMVSRRHAVIECRGSQFFLRDCNSSNGSLVNGDRVSERSLRDGDLVSIGTARLLFRDDAETDDPAGKVVPHPSAPRVPCPQCQAEARPGEQYCRQCGATLQPLPPKAVCASCGTVVPLPARFCSACGGALPALADSAGKTARPADEALGAVVERAPVEQPLPLRSGAVPQSSPSRAPAERPRAAPGRSFPRPAADSRPVRLPASREASPGRRLAAAAIDAAIVGLGQALLVVPVIGYWSVREQARSPADVPFLPIILSLSASLVAAVFAAAYYALYWGTRGATPGKRWLGIVVEGEDGRRPIGVGKALLRFLGYLLSGVLFGIGFVMILFGGRGLHDRIAGTRVVLRVDD